MTIRVLHDSSSIAFAQIAEEHRRAGHFEEAEQICRVGLAHHPGFLSARVTLALSLLALRRVEDAAAQLGMVLEAAPDHLGALRGLAEIEHGRGERETALHHYRAALALVPRDRELAERIVALEREALDRGVAAGPVDVAGTAAPVGAGGSSVAGQGDNPVAPEARAVAHLEAWLGAILTDRARRARGEAS